MIELTNERDVLEAFDDWMRRRGPLGAGASPERIFIAGWSAARRATPSTECADGLPPLPERDGDWAGDNWYTADSMRDYAREAAEADRRARHEENMALLAEMADLRAQLARAERALLRGGFEDHGAQEWKPPVNEVAGRLHRRVFELEGQLARQSQEPQGFRKFDMTDYTAPVVYSNRTETMACEGTGPRSYPLPMEPQAERAAVPIQRMYMDELDAGMAGEEWLAHHIPGAASLHRSPEPSGGQSPRVRWVALFDRNDRLTYGYMLTRDIMNWTQITFIDAAAPARSVAQPAPMPKVEQSELAKLDAEIGRLRRRLDGTPIAFSSTRFDLAMRIDRLEAQRKSSATDGAEGERHDAN